MKKRFIHFTRLLQNAPPGRAGMNGIFSMSFLHKQESSKIDSRSLLETCRDMFRGNEEAPCGSTGFFTLFTIPPCKVFKGQAYCLLALAFFLSPLAFRLSPASADPVFVGGTLDLQESLSLAYHKKQAQTAS